MTLEFLDAQGKVIRRFSSEQDSVARADSLLRAAERSRADSAWRRASDSLAALGVMPAGIGRPAADSARPAAGWRYVPPPRLPARAGMNRFSWNMRMTDAAGFDGMKPFAVMTVLLTRDLPMTPPMDGVLAQRARDAGKPIHYFELAVDQIAMIDPWMAPADVKAMLDNRELARKLSVDLIEAYRAGDDAALGGMFDDQTLWLAAGRKPETFPAYLDSILGKRDRAWVPQIEALHAGGGAFVAVGAGHLVGPGNVLDPLRARGFTITRVTGP